MADVRLPEKRDEPSSTSGKVAIAVSERRVEGAFLDPNAIHERSQHDRHRARITDLTDGTLQGPPDIRIIDSDHFMPFRNPDTVAELILEPLP
jgi:hypothetical protein